MIKKLLNSGLLLASQVPYLEWGKDYHSNIFQLEIELFRKAAHNPMSILHPLILIPFIGIGILIYTLFQKEPNRKLSIIGLITLSSIILMFLLVGIITANYKTIFSTVPFLIIAFFVLRINWKRVQKI